MRIYNQHVIDWIEQRDTNLVIKYLKKKCSSYAYVTKMKKHMRLKLAECNLIGSLTGKEGADYEPMFNGLGRDR